MKFRVVALIVALSSAFLASTAHVKAGTYFPSLLTGGIVNTLEDGSREGVIDVDKSGTLSIGDAIIGIAQFRLVNTTDLSAKNFSVYAIYTQQIVNIVPNGSNFDVYFGPTYGCWT
jgi:hypothetical protein